MSLKRYLHVDLFFVTNNVNTVELPIKNTPNKEHLPTKDTCSSPIPVFYCIIQPLNRGQPFIKDNFNFPKVSVIQRFRCINKYCTFTSAKPL